MPSAMIHEAIAKRVNEEYGMDEVLLRLGTIAPDSWRNVSKDSKYHDRLLTHFYNDKLDKKIKYDYDSFYKKYYEYLNDPFYFGYLLHLMVDCYWKTNIDNKFFIIEDGVIKYRLTNGSYIEDKDYFDYYDGLKIQRCLSKIFDLGKLPINIDFKCMIEEVDLGGLFGESGTVSYVNDKTVYNGIDEVPEIYDTKLILKYIDETVNYIFKELDRLKNISKTI